MHLIHLLIEADRNGEPFALAQRMGVQGLIFNCKSWYGGGLGRYSTCYKHNGKRDPDVDRTTAHKDHVHIELNWAGARKKRRAWTVRIREVAHGAVDGRGCHGVLADEIAPQDAGK